MDELCEIAERNTESNITNGFDIRSQYNSTDYARRNWYNACREFYTLALMSGNVNFDILANPELTRTIIDIVGADGDDEVDETIIHAVQMQLEREQRIDMADEMQQKADIAREIASGNAESAVKLQQLHEIASRCDKTTSAYIDLLILLLNVTG